MIREYDPTPERFLRDIGQHQLTVVRSNGTDRHLRFRRPGSGVYWFDLITWPGALCIDGDCGTHVFRRIDDMFQFFRHERINPSYWSEKLVSSNRRSNAEVKEFSHEKYKRAVVSQFRQHFRDREFSKARECFRELRDEILDRCDGEIDDWCYRAAMDFDSHGFEMRDFWEHDCTEYTFHFIWCLRAIVWGIQQFDAMTPATEEKAA